jgi:hypothetical protein
LQKWTNFLQKITQNERGDKIYHNEHTLFAHSFRRRKKATAANTTADKLL